MSRTIAVQLWANNGLGSLSGPCDVSSKLTEIGEIGWQIDDHFTVVQPGQFTGRIWDEDEAVWTWLQTQLATTRGGTTPQLLRPWIALTVAGEPVFLGMVDLQSIRRDEAAREVDLSADDWSVLLQDVALGGDTWSRTKPRGTVTRAQAGPYAGTRTDTQEASMVALPAAAAVQVGDTLQLAAGGTTYPVTEVIQQGIYQTIGTMGRPSFVVTGLLARLAGWAASGTATWTFNRLAAAAGDLSNYTLTRAVVPSDLSPVMAVQLDTTNGIYAGDTLTSPAGLEILVADVDPERSEIIPTEPITTAMAVGDTLSWSTETAAQLMYQDAAEILRKAAAPYAVDLSRFSPGAIPRAILGWLPLRLDGRDLQQISEIEPTLTQVRLLGAAGAWTGSPDVSWTPGAVGTRWADWTTQRATAPARLMPDDRMSIPGMTRARNRAYRTASYRHPVFRQSDGTIPAEPIYTPPTVLWPDAVFAYDYAQFRRLVVDGTAATLEEKRWSGSAWSAPTTVSWPVAGYHPASLVPMPGVAATSGPVAPQGQALLALAIATVGQACQLQLVHAGMPVVLDVSSTLMGAELVTTPWAAFLVSQQGYGRVRLQGGALYLDWVQILDAGSWFVPSSVAALDSGSLFILTRFSALSSQGTDAKRVLTSALINLTATPSPADPAGAVLFRETVCDGWPDLIMALRDPSDATRLLGILGGRFFQVCARQPRTIERLKAEGMTAFELVEHVAQLVMAIVVPLPTGVLQVVSRGSLGSVVAVTVDRPKVIESRLSKHFYSVVRVTGAKDDLFADAWGSTLGGKSLEIQSHPLIWTEGGCYGMAATFASFCGVPRRERLEDWFWESTSTTPPWETLPPWQRIQVNGASTTWFLSGLSHDLIKGDAHATLLEDPS